MIGRKDPVVKVKDIPKSKYTSADMIDRMQHHRGMPATIEEYIKKHTIDIEGVKVILVDRVCAALEYYYGDDGK